MLLPECFVVLIALPGLIYSAPPKFAENNCRWGDASPSGGKPTLPNEFQYMCAIGWQSKTNEKSYDYKCGGALIHMEFMLTAAHCLYGSEDPPIAGRCGGVNLTATEYFFYTIIKIIEHPDYKYPSTYNDIAILKISSIDGPIRIAYLPYRDVIENELMTAVGYGDTKFGGTATKQLLKIQVNAVSMEECQKYYEPDEINSVLKHGIRDTQLCAVDPMKLMNTCQGDSGGPLVRQHLGIDYVMGITSFGIGCENGPPGVYTRVTKYVSWIESVIRPWYNHEYPYRFALRWRNHITCQLEKKMCGAIKIRWNYLLIAAHCFYDFEEIPEIIEGAGFHLYHQQIAYIDFKIHPEYDHPLPYNDIALVEIYWNPFVVTPIWLENRLVNQTVMAVNFEETTEEAFKAQDLQKTALYLIPNEECNKFYSRGKYAENFTRGIVDTQLCAQDTEKRYDLKQGYSDGPLIMHVNELNVSVPYVVGISSYGRNCFNCPPGVFTRLSKYVEWMLQIFNSTQLPPDHFRFFQIAKWKEYP